MSVFIHEWKNVENPKGIVQIFHGMAEHGKRYEDFAKFLNSNGFLVVANDHRGHGKTAEKVQDLGNIGKNGFLKIVEDEKKIYKGLKKSYPHLPIFIFAHSFGSFIGQEFLLESEDSIDGIVLSGSAYRRGLDLKLAIFLAKLENIIFENNHKSIFLDRLSFYNFNKKFINKDSKFSWLTNDTSKVKDYENDPLCGFVFTSSSFYSFYRGIDQIFHPHRFSKLNKDIPILFLSGDLDPVGKYGKKVYKLHDFYKSLSFSNLSLKLYRDCGHEMINEINREKVYGDILKWINKNIV